MKKPPTTLLVAATMAIVPSTVESVRLVLARQDDGADHGDRVQRVGQRHQRRVQQRRNALITSNPMNAASMNTYRLVIRSIVIAFASLLLGHQRRQREEFAHPGVDHFAALRQQRARE